MKGQHMFGVVVIRPPFSLFVTLTMPEWRIVPARVITTKQCFVMNDIHGTACMAGYVSLRHTLDHVYPVASKSSYSPPRHQ